MLNMMYVRNIFNNIAKLLFLLNITSLLHIYLALNLFFQIVRFQFHIFTRECYKNSFSNFLQI